MQIGETDVIRLPALAALMTVVLLAAAGPVRADDAWNFSLSLGAGFKPEYQGSDELEFLPLASAKVGHGHRYAALRGTELSVNLLDSPSWHLGPLLRYRFGRDDADDPMVNLLRDVDPSLEMGLFVAYNLLNAADRRYGLTLRFDIAHDVLEGHEGMVARAGLTYRKPFGQQWIGTLGGSLGYADDTYMTTFFGVDANNASRSGLPFYDAGGNLKDATLRTSLSYFVTKQWSVTGLLNYTRLLADASDSPIVDRGSADQFFGGLMVGYKF